MQKVIGLAGHIDHGKTALVKALTGVDTDRLEEEKRRGVTIDIGIAFYNEETTFIDVPGHERFIKNMVTGVATVDIALLVIAADDGIMPQTREHLDILSLLGVERVIVAMNKIDLVEGDWVELVQEEVAAYLAESGYGGAPIIPVSAEKGTGIETLRTALDQTLAAVPARPNDGLFRLPIDRVFSIKGFGTIVTGTVLSHELRKGQNVTLYPQDQTYTVRGMQSHNQDVPQVRLGDRAALNLAGARVDELGRGAFLGTPELYQTGAVWLGQLRVLDHWQRPVKEADHVHVHVGTGKREARVHLLQANECQPGQRMVVQLFFDEPISATFGESTIVRFESPEETLGGVRLTWAHEGRIRKSDARVGLLAGLLEKDLNEQVKVALTFFREPLTRRDLARRLSRAESKLQKALDPKQGIRCVSDRYILDARFAEIEQDIVNRLESEIAHDPRSQGLLVDTWEAIPNAELTLVLGALLAEGTLKNQGQRWQLAGQAAGLSDAEQVIRNQIVNQCRKAAFAPPDLQQIAESQGSAGKPVVDWMIREGELVKIEGGIYLLDSLLQEGLDLLRAWFREHETLTIAEAKDFIPTTRKYLIPILNYFEKKGFILRQGDMRIWVGEEIR